jgi:hypothetical protein
LIESHEFILAAKNRLEEFSQFDEDIIGRYARQEEAEGTEETEEQFIQSDHTAESAGPSFVHPSHKFVNYDSSDPLNLK